MRCGAPGDGVPDPRDAIFVGVPHRILPRHDRGGVAQGAEGCRLPAWTGLYGVSLLYRRAYKMPPPRHTPLEPEPLRRAPQDFTQGRTVPYRRSRERVCTLSTRRWGTVIITIIFILLIAAVSLLPYPYSDGETILNHIF